MTWFDPSENSAATADQQREGIRRVGVMMTPGTSAAKDMVSFLVAHETWQNLDMYRRAEPPAKPEDWPADLQRVVERIRFASALTQPKKDDKELIASFGVWRAAVLSVESRNAGRLEMLLESIRVHERVMRETGDEVETVRALRAFVETEYNCKLPKELPSFWASRAWCAWTVQERELLPSWLRNLADKPRSERGLSKGFTASDFSDEDDDI